MYFSGQAISSDMEIQIRQIRLYAEFYQNMELQFFVGDAAIETFLQSLTLYNTKLRKTLRNFFLKPTESLSVTLGFHY